MNGVQKAIENAGGSEYKLGKLLGVSRQAINLWTRSGRVPPRMVLACERLTGVHRHYLNPNIYPEAPGRPVKAGRPKRSIRR